MLFRIIDVVGGEKWIEHAGCSSLCSLVGFILDAGPAFRTQELVEWSCSWLSVV